MTYFMKDDRSFVENSRVLLENKKGNRFVLRSFILRKTTENGTMENGATENR